MSVCPVYSPSSSEGGLGHLRKPLEGSRSGEGVAGLVWEIEDGAGSSLFSGVGIFSEPLSVVDHPVCCPCAVVRACVCVHVWASVCVAFPDWELCEGSCWTRTLHQGLSVAVKVSFSLPLA